MYNKAYMIKVEDLGKIYNTNGTTAVGLQHVSAELDVGEFVAITGESGSGKSTFLNVVSCLDTYEEGELFIDGQNIGDLSKKELDVLRSKYISFIFQDYNIIDSYTVLDNVKLPLIALGKSEKEASSLALEAIKKVGLGNRAKYRGSKLSGGEKQRTVIARALVSNTPILACDEPTGNLDSETSKEIIKLISENSKGKLVLFVTHDYDSIKDYVSRKIVIKDGHIVEDKKVNSLPTYEAVKPIERKNIGFWHRFLISSKSIISKPKKSFLAYLVAIFGCLGILMSSVGAMLSVTSINLGYYNNTFAFKNGVDNRVTVVSKSLGDDVYDSIDKNYKYVDRGNLISDIQFMFQTSDSNSEFKTLFSTSEFASYLGTTNSRQTTLKFGRAPQNEGEMALIYNSKTNSKTIANLKKICDVELPVNVRTFSTYNDAFKNIKITGIYKSDYYSKNENKGLQSAYSLSVLFNETTFKKFNDLIYNIEYHRNIDCGLESSVSSFALQYKGQSLTFLDANYATEYNSIVVSKDLENVDFNLVYKGITIEKSKIPNIIYKENIGTNSFSCFQGPYNKYLDYNFNLATTFFEENSTDYNSICSSYSSRGYAVSNGICDSYDSLRAISPIVGFGMSLLKGLVIIAFAVIFLFVYSIIKKLMLVVLSDDKKESTIFETLGYSQHDISSITINKLFIYFVISALLAYIAAIVIFTFIPSSDITNVFINQLTDLRVVIVYILVTLIICFNIALKQRKKMLSQSVVRSLKDGSFI